jgi:hypothetical protein
MAPLTLPQEVMPTAPGAVARVSMDVMYVQEA